MYVLMIAHIGETLGHLVRGLSIADELTARGIQVELACSPRAASLLENWRIQYPHHRIRWDFSHNSMAPDVPSTRFLSFVTETTSDVVKLLNNTKPDLVIGLPGVFSVQAARSLGIPHISILHGPWLSPIVSVEKPTAVELAVLNFAQRIFMDGCVDRVYSHLSRTMGFPDLNYQGYLESETIFVPQPGLCLPTRSNIIETKFIRASFGPQSNLNHSKLEDACYVTFGSGNPCDISIIVELAQTVFPTIIVSTGKKQLRYGSPKIISQTYIASSTLAGRVAAVISHGGIGTVGTFAEYGTPQLIIPTEIDQATMAVHAVRFGIAKQYGLDVWARQPRLGRHLPDINKHELHRALIDLRLARNSSTDILADGAAEIASALSNWRLTKEKIQFMMS